MADSNITKRALAAALKELMEEESFQKISVADICDHCSMNRKSFYYHFQDKYDLVNWIFDTEFIAAAKGKTRDMGSDSWARLELLFRYFHENRSFYRKILTMKGQNSLSEHFREILYPVLANRLGEIMAGQEVHSFYMEFYADALICSIERWLLDKDCMPPDEFLSLLKRLVQSAALFVYREMESEE